MNTKMLEPMLIDYYLPEHIRSHMRLLGLTRTEADAKVEEIMSDPEKKEKYMKVIEELAREESE